MVIELPLWASDQIFPGVAISWLSNITSTFPLAPSFSLWFLRFTNTDQKLNQL